jgi:hypothetical protein
VPDSSASVGFGFGTPFEEQLAYFRQKLNLPTEAYDDVTGAGHDRAFIVTGAAKADILDELHGAIERTMASGGSLEDFRKAFPGILQRTGWTGWTGEGTADGEAWRTKVIYQTNMATSYAAGRWKQLNDPDLLKSRPYWRYIHADNVLHPRPLHLEWNGLVLRHDDPFWLTHFPPNGWGCHCRVTAVAKVGPGDKTAPPAGWDKPLETTGAPPGIDKTFGYAPGANVDTSLARLIDQKLINLSSPVGAQMAQVLEPVIAAERRTAWTAMVNRIEQKGQANGETLLATVVKPAVVQALADKGVVLQNAAVWLRDHELAHGLRDAKQSRATTLPADVWAQLPDLLDTAATYLDTVDEALIYVIDLDPKAGKVVVQVNFNRKGQFDGVRAKVTSNFIDTGGLVDPTNIDPTRYEPL